MWKLQAELVRIDGTRLEAEGVTPDIVLTPRQTADERYIERIAIDAVQRVRSAS